MLISFLIASKRSIRLLFATFPTHSPICQSLITTFEMVTPFRLICALLNLSTAEHTLSMWQRRESKGELIGFPISSHSNKPSPKWLITHWLLSKEGEELYWIGIMCLRQEANILNWVFCGKVISDQWNGIIESKFQKGIILLSREIYCIEECVNKTVATSFFCAEKKTWVNRKDWEKCMFERCLGWLVESC